MPSKPTRRQFAVALGATLLAPASMPAAAQNAAWPTKPITLVLPDSAGGSADSTARAMVPTVSAILGQPIVLLNRPGAGGILAVSAALQAPADGHTILYSSMASNVMNYSLYSKLEYVPDDFTNVIDIGYISNVLVVRADSPYKTAADVIKAARANPGKLTFASSGVGYSSHLAAELFKSVNKLDTLHIPHKGSIPAHQALLAGDVDFYFDYLAVAAPQIKSGRIRALAVTSRVREKSLPDVPTLQELGQDVLVEGWGGIAVRRGTPQAAVDKIHAAFSQGLRDPAVLRLFDTVGTRAGGGISQREFDKYVNDEIKRWAKIVADAKIPKM